MINIVIPAISIEPIDNGWIVQWRKANPDEKSQHKTIPVTMTCSEINQIKRLIQKAREDISSLDYWR